MRSVLALLLALGSLLLGLVLISFAIGRYPVTPGTVVAVMLAKVCSIGATWSPETEAVVLAIRLPRIASAVLVGAALSASGAAYQGLFRNPMVSPGILGVSSGASLGAAVAILLGLGTVGIQGSAFVGGLGAVALTWAMSSMVRGGSDPVLVTVLAGTIVSALLAALVALVKLVADPSNALPTITYWLMGSLASVGTNDVALAAVPIIGGLAVLLSLGFPLDILCFGDDEAKALGAEPARLRLVIIIAATLVTAASVAISGVIGLVGLVVPHLARMLVGPGHRRLIPAAALLGGAFLLAVDDVARSLFAIEVPLGILTSIIGAPFFLYLLQRGRGGWT